MAAILLSGCTTQEKQPVIEGLTVDDAKAQSQDWEKRIAELVPGEGLTIRQEPAGLLRRCDSEGAYRWTGVTFVEIDHPISKAEADEIASALVERVQAEVDDDYLVGTWDGGDVLALEVHAPDGALYRASARREGETAVVMVTSASPCFMLPDDVYPGGNF